MTKLCPRCSTVKPITQFYKKGVHTQPYCKPCFNNYCMERWLKRKVEAIAYKGGQCSSCKQEFHYSVYEFHHRFDETKEFQWTELRLKSWKSIVKELDKCDLLCANCHRRLHWDLALFN